MTFPPLQRVEWMFWLAVVYVVAMALYLLVDYSIRVVRAYLVQRELNSMPPIDERTERARRAALTFPRRREL